MANCRKKGIGVGEWQNERDGRGGMANCRNRGVVVVEWQNERHGRGGVAIAE